MTAKYISLLCAAAFLLGANSCRESIHPGKAAGDTATIPSPLPADTASEVLKDTATQTTPAKYDTLRIEGIKQPVRLTEFNEPNYGVLTYFPERDFLPQTSASGEGMAVNFSSNFGGQKNEKAHVNIFFPVGNPGIDQLRDMTIGPRGIFAANKWRLIKSDKKTKLLYQWAHEQYVFQHKNGDNYTSGSVIIGEASGRRMQVVLKYPVDYAEGFMPRAHILLKHLKISALKESGF